MLLYLLILYRCLHISLQAQNSFDRLLGGALSLTFSSMFYQYWDGERDPARGRRAVTAGQLRRNRYDNLMRWLRHPDVDHTHRRLLA